MTTYKPEKNKIGQLDQKKKKKKTTYAVMWLWHNHLSDFDILELIPNFYCNKWHDKDYPFVHTFFDIFDDFPGTNL